jgi:hypothetical protein
MGAAAPEADGLIRHAGTLPLEKLAPGSHELRVTIANGGQVLAARAAPFIVTE